MVGPFSKAEALLLLLGATCTALVLLAWVSTWAIRRQKRRQQEASIDRSLAQPPPANPPWLQQQPVVLQKAKKPERKRVRVQTTSLAVQEPPRPAKGPRVVFLPGRLSFVRAVHLDQCVPGDLAAILRHQNIECSVTSEVGLTDASDAHQCAYARRERKLLITHDHDFKALDAEGEPHAGIIHAPVGKRYHEEIVRMVLRLFAEKA